MPNPLIPPFSAEGSSGPFERDINPSTLEQIIFGLLAGASNFAQPGSGGGILNLFGQDIEQRRQRAQNTISGQILGQGLQLGQTPETITDQPAVQGQFAGGLSPSAIVQQIQGGRLPQIQNPAYADLIQKILQGSQQFAQLGGDPNVLAGVLGKGGILTSPGERVAAQKAKLDLGKQIDLKKYRQELVRLRDDTNKISAESNEIRSRQVRVIEKKADGLTDKDVGKFREEALKQYFKEKKNYDNRINRQWLLETGLEDNPPTLEEWKAQKGVAEFPDQESFITDWMSAVLPQGGPMATPTAKIGVNQPKLKPMNAADIAEIKKLGGRKWLDKNKQAIISQGVDPDSYKE